MKKTNAFSESILRLSAVIDRDLKKFMRNPIVIGMSFLMPIIYLVIMGNSFQGKLQSLPLVVINHDSGRQARDLFDNLRAIESGPATLTIFQAKDEQAAVADVRNGKYKAALIIPSDFSKRVDLKSRPEVGLFLDNTDGISSGTIIGVVNGAVAAVRSGYVAIREAADEIHVRNANLYRNVDYFQSLVPGVVVMAIFLGTLTTGVFNVVMDRFLGIEESYLLTPLTKANIVGGLILSGLAITTVVSILVLGVGLVMTGIPLPTGIWSLASLLVVIILTILCLQSLMFVLLGRANHPRIVGVLSGFMNVILFFPSGAVYPTSSLPGWLRSFAMVNPEAYAVDALKALLFKSAGFTAILADISFLTVFMAIMMMAAIMLFKRTL
ncbi:MAG TPA: ABC transporter permease [Sulfuricella sp.]|nr:ABC transporter permease [Sulfuricella sp.]